MWLHAMFHDMWLFAVHIPGSLNVETDKESRVFHGETEWMLNKNRFHKPTSQLFNPCVVCLLHEWISKQTSTFLGVQILKLMQLMPFCMTGLSIHLCLSSIQCSGATCSDQKRSSRKPVVHPYWSTQSRFPTAPRCVSHHKKHFPGAVRLWYFLTIPIKYTPCTTRCYF